MKHLNLKDTTRIEIGKEVPTNGKGRMRTQLRKNVLHGLFCEPKGILEQQFTSSPMGADL